MYAAILDVYCVCVLNMDIAALPVGLVPHESPSLLNLDSLMHPRRCPFGFAKIILTILILDL